MKFLLIDPAKKAKWISEFPDYPQALEAVGLTTHNVDHGSLGRKHGIFVYEFGLFKPVAESHYFSIGSHLYEGPAVVFQADDQGETVDVTDIPTITYYNTPADVEHAITAGVIYRPQTAVNGQVFWQWPDPQRG